jgi:hypothetical protein
MGRLYIGSDMTEVTKLVKDNYTLMGYRDKTLVVEINNIDWKNTDIYWEDIELETYIPPEQITKTTNALELENKQLKVRIESLEYAMLNLMDKLGGK